MQKKMIYLRVSVHWIKAAIIANLRDRKINLKEDSLREIAAKIGTKKVSAQVIKHHLEALVNMGTLDKVNGEYFFNESAEPFTPSKTGFKY